MKQHEFPIYFMAKSYLNFFNRLVCDFWDWEGWPKFKTLEGKEANVFTFVANSTHSY